jgi:hypothetical protein
MTSRSSTFLFALHEAPAWRHLMIANHDWALCRAPVTRVDFTLTTVASDAAGTLEHRDECRVRLPRLRNASAISSR